MSEKSYVGMLNCWICSGGAEILLDTRLRPTLEKNIGSRPNIICSECESKAEDNDGIWLISIREGELPPTHSDEAWNPYRSGGLVLLKKSALKRMFTVALNKDALKEHLQMVDNNIYFYLHDKVWTTFGLPEIGAEINNLEDE